MLFSYFFAEIQETNFFSECTYIDLQFLSSYPRICQRETVVESCYSFQILNIQEQYMLYFPDYSKQQKHWVPYLCRHRYIATAGQMKFQFYQFKGSHHLRVNNEKKFFKIRRKKNQGIRLISFQQTSFWNLGDSKAEMRRASLKWDQDKFNLQVRGGKK